MIRRIAAGVQRGIAAIGFDADRSASVIDVIYAGEPGGIFIGIVCVFRPHADRRCGNVIGVKPIFTEHL